MGLQDSPGVWKHSMNRFVTREMPNKTMKPACSDPRKSPIQMGRTSLSHILDAPSPIEATLSAAPCSPTSGVGTWVAHPDPNVKPRLHVSVSCWESPALGRLAVLGMC